MIPLCGTPYPDENTPVPITAQCADQNTVCCFTASFSVFLHTILAPRAKGLPALCRTPRQVPGRPHKGFSAAALSLGCFPIRTIPHLRHYMYVIVVQKGRFVKPLRHGSLPSFIWETLHPMNHVPLNRCSFQPLRNRILRFDKVLFSPRTSAQKNSPSPTGEFLKPSMLASTCQDPMLTGHPVPCRLAG